jgi:hypothetical protein
VRSACLRGIAERDLPLHFRPSIMPELLDSATPFQDSDLRAASWLGSSKYYAAMADFANIRHGRSRAESLFNFGDPQSSERDVSKELQHYIGKKKKTSNPPTPRDRRAAAWQALTCLDVAKAKKERPTPNVEVRGRRLKLAAQSSIQNTACREAAG